MLVPDRGGGERHGFRSRPATVEVPQGSVLWPTPWNVFYDGLLKMAVPVRLIGFADDFAVVAVAHTDELLERAINPVWGGPERVDDGERPVPQSPQVPEAVMLACKWAYVALELREGNDRLPFDTLPPVPQADGGHSPDVWSTPSGDLRQNLQGGRSYRGGG